MLVLHPALKSPIDMKLKDIIHSVSAISPQKGLVAYEFVSNHLKSSKDVEISFEGIEDCTSAFCNSFVGKLYMTFDTKLVDSKLHLTDIDKDNIWFKKLETAKLLGTNENIRQVRQSSIEDLMNH